MTIYAYRCRECGNALDSTVHGLEDIFCPVCEDVTSHGRIYSVNVWRPMHEHMNATTGQPVSDMNQFKDQLKAQSEEASIRTGIEHNYEPIDPDQARKTVEESNGVGLESTNRARHKEGQRAIDL